MRKRLIVLALAVVITVVGILAFSGIALAAPFPDLGSNVLNGYALQEIQVRGMSQGFADGLWRPFNDLNRAQFVKMAVENFGIPLANPATPTFTDVPKTDTFYQYIEGAVAAGLTGGVGNNLFAPGRAITREEAAAILVRWVAKANDFTASSIAASDITAALATFDDAAGISTGLRAEVAIAVDLGLLQGSADELSPQRTLVRIGGAALLARSSFSLGSVYSASLDALNNSGVSGTALLFLRGSALKVLVLAHGLESGQQHMQHIHGMLDGSQATCPPDTADVNHDGIITLAEGLPFYGPILRPLDDPYPTAQGSDGMVFYSHTYSGSDLDALNLSTVSLTKRVIVLHGKTINGAYDASLPVACGPITAISLAYHANLDELNDSGTFGQALMWLQGQKLRTLVVAQGAETAQQHMQHIHGMLDGSKATCPPASADANHDGIITLAEGLPFYGPILRPLDDPYPVAQGTAGTIFYSHTYSGSDLDALKLATAPLTNRVVVMHGMTLNGAYDASVPIACGEIEDATTLQNVANSYTVHPLVSDLASLAPVVDPNLVNGWGIVAGPTTPWWVADNGTDKSTLYNGAGTKQALVVDVASAPTGTVFNSSTVFPVTSGAASAAARFLFATEKGTILGWNPNVPAAGSTTALVVADRSGVDAVYKGLAIGSVGTAPYLYATDFANGRIDVFDGAFALQTWAGAFVDPALPTGYGPFGIQTIGDNLFVTFAKQNPPSTDEMAGPGLGFVDEFAMNGDFVARVATHGLLNAPWGLAIAPAGFGRFSGCLLVGNFGDGHINAYIKAADGTWTPRGILRVGNGNPLFIDGLWGIGFGFGNANSGPATTLYFAAGPNDEADGLFGSITTP